MRRFAVWFTGVPASGKTTLGNLLREELETKYGLATVPFDGDIVRSTISYDLGFSERDREENNLRVLWATSYLPSLGFVPVVTLILPSSHIRSIIRRVYQHLKIHFILIHVEAPIEERIKRDPKGLYKKAMRHDIHLTGYNSDYDVPTLGEYDLKLQTDIMDTTRCIEQIVRLLEVRGLLNET